jgi:hypothetical protein
MKIYLLILLSAFCLEAHADKTQSISGTVQLAKKLQTSVTKTSVLFIFAKRMGGIKGPPAAVIRISAPKFPLAYSLSAANAMIPGTAFDGPFELTARLTSSGNALQKRGSFEGILSSKKGILVGTEKNIIIINKKR